MIIIIIIIINMILIDSKKALNIKSPRHSVVLQTDAKRDNHGHSNDSKVQ